MNYKFILLIPIFEILSFILLGDFLGFWTVVSLILFTGLIGLLLIRSELNFRQIEKLVSEPNEWLFKKIAGFLLDLSISSNSFFLSSTFFFAPPLMVASLHQQLVYRPDKLGV